MTQPINNSSSSSKKVDAHESHVSSGPADQDTYISDIREKLNKIQTKMNSMREDNSRLVGDLRRKADENLTRLDTKYKEVKSGLDELKNCTKEKWAAEKEAFQKSFQDLSMNFKGLFN
ncbi:MAG: hypothetical protein COV44_09645 [Deltaproteobacteria bacterium CG11_big_fil_rev_8_21_14_0_20_45_16]|nr:MAG: hypothetical protein COV44_09645 [Deltaproteobacteria bacterium CG11_big_fil_rev_8_21_14_0_20_45_16]